MDKNVKLPKRLLAAAEFVRARSKCADVGCDHGKLAAYLIQSGSCESVVASDINEQPLEKAKKLFCELGITDRARTVLCDGLSGIDPNDADDVVIAGLGCDTILSIIDGAPWLREDGKRLVFVPASHHSQLRAGLYERGYKLLCERAVREDNHYYAVMSAAYCGERIAVSPLFASIGLIVPHEADGADYIKNERRKAALIASSGADDAKKEAARALCVKFDEVLK